MGEAEEVRSSRVELKEPPVQWTSVMIDPPKDISRIPLIRGSHVHKMLPQT